MSDINSRANFFNAVLISIKVTQKKEIWYRALFCFSFQAVLSLEASRQLGGGVKQNQFSISNFLLILVFENSVPQHLSPSAPKKIQLKQNK
ncbi:hypothetical protein [Flavobacterium filum]|uniref:hypothetical protein n=1 Tax=Flavobacterium TaxID=237 RepID=UPI00047B8965|nr:hypothetical protein [Flavobacterium filum]